MSQNNLNKFPKHIQHVRLQKEEDEEQWISGEELCTDGSSDEETNPNETKKKCKPRTVYYPTKEPVQVTKTSVNSSNSSSTSETTEESDSVDSSSKLTTTEWRPKRGSIKLPNIEERFKEPFDIETEKWNTEFQYTKLLNNISLEKSDTENNVNSEYDMNNINVTFLDNKIRRVDSILRDCRRDRKIFQKQVCENIKLFDNTPFESRNTKKFHELFNFKSNNVSEKQMKKRNYKTNFKKQMKYPLFKTHKMAVSLLNDEQKARLEFLLSDIDVDDIEIKNGNDELNEKEDKNGFKSTKNELFELSDVEKKIKTLQERGDADLKSKLCKEVYSVDEENREWKSFLKSKQDKIRKINNQLQSLREKEVEKSTENESKTEEHFP